MLNVFIGGTGCTIGSMYEASITDEARGQSRCLFVDSDPHAASLIKDRVRAASPSPSSSSSSSSSFVTGHCDFGGIYSKHLTEGRPLCAAALDQVRRHLEEQQQHRCPGIALCRGVSGGTGSGVGRALIDRLRVEFPKLTILDCKIFDGGTAPLQRPVVAPYNHMLALGCAQGRGADMNMLFDSSAVYEVLQRRNATTSIKRSPTFADINRHVAQIFAAITPSIFEYRDSMVPYPRLNSFMASYTQTIGSVAEMTAGVFEPDSYSVAVDTRQGKYLGCTLWYGGHHKSQDIGVIIRSLKAKRRSNFIDWSPFAIKWNVDNTTQPFRSVCHVANNTEISQVFTDVEQRVAKMREMCSHMFWFVAEGMDYGEFSESSSELALIAQDYEDCGYDGPWSDESVEY